MTTKQKQISKNLIFIKQSKTIRMELYQSSEGWGGHE
jgi:hypothetical protein